jgi:hypothetical protein
MIDVLSTRSLPVCFALSHRSSRVTLTLSCVSSFLLVATLIAGMMDRVVSAYRAVWDDEYYWTLTWGGTACAIASLLVLGLPLTALAYWDPAALRRYKVQSGLTREMVAAIVGPALRSMFVNYVCSIVMLTVIW